MVQPHAPAMGTGLVGAPHCPHDCWHLAANRVLSHLRMPRLAILRRHMRVDRMSWQVCASLKAAMLSTSRQASGRSHAITVRRGDLHAREENHAPRAYRGSVLLLKQATVRVGSVVLIQVY